MTFDADSAAAEAVKPGRAHRLIEWPNEPGRTLALVVLSEDERFNSTVAAARYLRQGLKLDALEMALVESDELMEHAKQCFRLAVALRRPDAVDVPAFEAEALRLSITKDEREALVRMYEEYERERAPISASNDPEKTLQEVIALGKDEAQWTWAMCCEPDTLRSIVICMLRRLQQPTNDSSSDT